MIIIPTILLMFQKSGVYQLRLVMNIPWFTRILFTSQVVIVGISEPSTVFVQHVLGLSEFQIPLRPWTNLSWVRWTSLSLTLPPITRPWSDDLNGKKTRKLFRDVFWGKKWCIKTRVSLEVICFAKGRFEVIFFYDHKHTNSPAESANQLSMLRS